MARSEPGVIYFGSAQGLCCFLPRQVLSVNRAPKTIRTSLRLIRGIEQTDSVINLAILNHISLAYDENSFAINFTVKNFAMENYVEYSYMPVSYTHLVESFSSLSPLMAEIELVRSPFFT